MFKNSSTWFAWCFREFVSEFDIDYPFLIWEVFIVNALK